MFLIGAGLAELVLLAAAGWGGGPSWFPLPGIPLLGGAFAAYLLGAWATGGALGSTERPAKRGRRSRLTTIWIFGVAFRLALLPLAPELSDDVYRYLWDGHVQLQGVNPYLHPPDAEALEGLRTTWHSLVNHPDVPTIYPPGAQVAFLVIALAGGTVLRAKLLWLFLDLATAWLLLRVARRTGRPGARVLVLYLWSPLLVVETAWSGHLEPLGLFGLALLLALVRQPAKAGLGAAVATLTKLAPAAALPPLLRRLGWRFMATFLLVTVVLYLPYVAAGGALWTGLATYARHWRFNAGGFWLLEQLLPGGAAPRWAAGAGVVAVVAWTTWRRFDPERALFWILGTGLLLSPTVHPWYVLWLLPFAALRRSPPWIALSGLVFLAYWGLGGFQATGVWVEPSWARLTIWLPVAGLLVVEGVRLVRKPAPT